MTKNDLLSTNRNDLAFADAVRRVQAFVEEHGHARVPMKHVSPDGFKLGYWVVDNRRRNRQGRLTQNRIAYLEREVPTWEWETLGDVLWEKRMTELRQFVGEHGHAVVPQHYLHESGFALGDWVKTHRKRYAAGTSSLSAARIAELEALPGWVWNAKDAQFETGYAALLAHVHAGGSARVPSKYTTQAGFPLGEWVAGQRLGRRGKGRRKMTPERAARLEALPGWAWNPSTD